MSIESIKHWQWVIIGAIVGLAIAAIRVQTGVTVSLDDRPGMSLPEFADLASLPASGDQPPFRNLTIYPAIEGKNFVTGEYRSSGFFTATKYIPFQLNAPVPFRLPRSSGAPSPTFTVRDYLAQVNPSLAYRYVWYASDSAQFLVWTVGSTLLIGGLWPLALRLLVGAGYGRKLPPEPAYDLDRFASGDEPSTSAPPAEMSPEDAARLAALRQTLEAQLASTDPAAPATPTCEQPAPAIARLNGGPYEPESNSEQSKDPKDYQGEFYPVARAGQNQNQNGAE